MTQIIYKHQLEELARSLEKDFEVIAPIEEHPDSTFSKFVFKKLGRGDHLALGYPTTILPPKDFLLPQDDVLFEYSGSEVKKPNMPKQLIFGVSYEDLEGISKLIDVFARPVEDEPFLNRAKNTAVVAIDRFSPPKGLHFDLYLQKISAEKYAAFAGSVAGKKILANPLFKNEGVTVPKVKKAEDPLLNHPKLAVAIEKSKGGPVWDDLVERCFACGICSFVCPLCYCFSEEDEVDFPVSDNKTGRRVRRLNSCFSADFAKTSGHNFRPDRKDRIYNWYFHKFVRMPAELGFSGCVDCMRCTVFCPAKISYRMVLTEVLNDYLKTHPNESK